MKKGYRIISIEAADIYRQEQENGVSVGYKMPENKSDAYFRLFKIYLDYSRDLIELEKAYIVNSNRFKDFMLKGGSPIGFVEENKEGKIIVFGKKFARK